MLASDCEQFVVLRVLWRFIVRCVARLLRRDLRNRGEGGNQARQTNEPPDFVPSREPRNSEDRTGGGCAATYAGVFGGIA